MSANTWPPPADLLAFRPMPTEPNGHLSGWHLRDRDGNLPEWARRIGVSPDDDERAIPAYDLASSITDSGAPGGGGSATIWAVRVDGRFRIVITDSDEIFFAPPLDDLAELPTLEELLTILDETLVEDEVWPMGHPARENSHPDSREDARGFVTLVSDLYPMLAPLDRARFEAWVEDE